MDWILGFISVNPPPFVWGHVKWNENGVKVQEVKKLMGPKVHQGGVKVLVS